MQDQQIQSYDVQRDESAVLVLWQETLGDSWPIQPARFRQVLASPEAQHFVVREQGTVIGFAATSKSTPQKVGYLPALLVAPHRQRQGVGTALHAAALKHLSGLSSVQLGSTSPRFWCGVPGNLPLATAFFSARGWQFADTVYDIVQDLQVYTTPLYVQQRIERERISFAPATRQNIADVLAFEASAFPHWLASYQNCADLGDYQDLLVAYDDTGRVVGTLIMYSAQSHPGRTDLIWQTLLGTDAGAIGSVGVAESERGRGIGLALVARASELQQERAVRNCYIDWVVLTDFYARLGYQKWRDYQTSWRGLTT